MARLSLAAPSTGGEPGSRVASLPPAPGSFALVMSGLLAVGAFQTSRVLPRLNIAAAPDWYFASATQIGHVTPFELGFANLSLSFTDPPPLCVNPFELVRLELVDLPVPEVIPTRAPRSPPAATISA